MPLNVKITSQKVEFLLYPKGPAMTFTRRSHAEGALAEIDVDDLLEEAMGESSSETEEDGAGAFDLVKLVKGDRSSPSRTAEQDPSSDDGQEKCQKVCQDSVSSTAARTSSSHPASLLLKKDSELLPTA